MDRKRSGLGLALAVLAGCLALLLLLLGLATRSGAQDDDPALGFPLVVAGLIVVATLLALGWRAVTRSRSSSDR